MVRTSTIRRQPAARIAPFVTHVRRVLAASISCAVLALPGVAAARRPTPNYDGRRPESHTTENVALAVPRALLAPFWLLLQGLRVPAGAAVRSPLAVNLFETASGVSTDLSSHVDVQSRVGLAPRRNRAAGRRPLVGALAAIRRLGYQQHTLRLLFATGGEGAFDGEIWDRQAWSHNFETGVRFSWYERPDVPFYGPPGTDGAPEAEQRAFVRRVGGSVTITASAGRYVQVHVATGMRGTETDLGTAPWVLATQQSPRDSYIAWNTDAEVAVDSRDRSESGFRAAIRGHHGVVLTEPLERRWVVVEGHAGAYSEVMAPRRVIGLELMYAHGQALGSQPLPFAEIPTLGGGDPMNGFLEGRMRANDVAAVSLVYRWPVWVWLDGVSHIAVGGILHDNAEVSIRDLHASWDVGVRTRPGGLVDGTLLFGLGSARFDAPVFGLERARVLFALSRSF